MKEQKFTPILFDVLKLCRVNGKDISFEHTLMWDLFTFLHDSNELEKECEEIYDILIGNNDAVEQHEWLSQMVLDIILLLALHNKSFLTENLIQTGYDDEMLPEILKHIMSNVFYKYSKLNGQIFVNKKLISIN